jgi:site-specific DNA-cytosine methylase
MLEHYGGGRRQPKILIMGEENGKLDDGTLESKKGFQGKKRNMLSMRKTKKNGDTPQGQGLAQQRYGESPRGLSELSQQTSQAPEEMQVGELSKQNETVRILREAQPKVREIRESSNVQEKSIYAGCRVRRLTCTECERLQAFPDGWTKYGVNEKGETVEISDSQRYKCLGNSVTTSVIKAIMERILKL